CRKLEKYEEAAGAYHAAMYFANFNNQKRKEIAREWSEMIDGLMSTWEKPIKDKIEKDPALKKLVRKYPLVVLHSRRYGGGGYVKSAFSFNHETSDAEKHRNDVQLLFDNGRRPVAFEVNMIADQENRVSDLGPVEFDKVAVPAKIDFKD